jgi:hypothetical protein
MLYTLHLWVCLMNYPKVCTSSEITPAVVLEHCINGKRAVIAQAHQEGLRVVHALCYPEMK